MAEKRKKCHGASVDHRLMSAVQYVDFQGEKISTVKDEQTGKVYCLPRELAEQLGLEWSSQLRKLKKGLYINNLLNVPMNMESGERDITLLNIDILHTWLFSIQSERVHADVRAKLVAYQQECVKVLRDYWTKGVAVNPRADRLAHALDRYPEMRAIVQSLEAAAQARFLAEQAQAQAARAETKADLALEDAKRMTIEQFVLKNGLLRQFPVAQWRGMATWLTRFCQEWALTIQKEPVPGKLWADENSYPLDAFGAWWRHEQQKARQIHLVTKTEED